MPTTASMPIASSVVDLLRVVMPPAAVTRRDVARAHGADRVHVDAPHQALGVDVGVEELAAERLERARRLRPAASGSGVRQPWMTTWPPRLSTAAMTRSAPIASGQRCRERRGPDGPSREERRADDDVRARRRRARACARSTDRMPPPTRQGSAAQICRDERVVVAGAHARRRDRSAARAGSRANRRTHAKTSSRREREALALDELDDVAALEIDGGNQHA